MENMKYTRKTLPNGIRLITITGFSTSAITISAYLRAGFRFDPKNRPGLAHFTEHMLFNGTKSFPTPRDVAYAIEQYGGWHRAFTWIEHQTNTIHLPKGYLETGIKLLMETLSYPLIKKSEVEREKGVIKEEILTNKADPSKGIWDYAWFPVFFQDTPLARPYSGTDKDVLKISDSDVKAFITRHFQPKNTVIFVVGDLQVDHVTEIVCKYMQNYKNSVEISEKNFFRIEPKVKKRVIVYNDTSYYQTSIAVGVKSVPFNHPLKHIFEILREMLAGYFAAPLIQRLREQGGLIYTWNAFQDNVCNTGYLVLNFSIAHKNVKRVITIILKEFDRLAQGKFEKKEVDVARNHLMGRILANIQTGKDYIEWYGLQELLTSNEVLSIEEQTEVYKNISVEEVKKTAMKYLCKDKILIGVLGIADETYLNKSLS